MAQHLNTCTARALTRVAAAILLAGLEKSIFSPQSLRIVTLSAAKQTAAPQRSTFNTADSHQRHGIPQRQTPSAREARTTQRTTAGSPKMSPRKIERAIRAFVAAVALLGGDIAPGCAALGIPGADATDIASSGSLRAARGMRLRQMLGAGGIEENPWRHPGGPRGEARRRLALARGPPIFVAIDGNWTWPASDEGRPGGGVLGASGNSLRRQHVSVSLRQHASVSLPPQAPLAWPSAGVNQSFSLAAKRQNVTRNGTVDFPPASGTPADDGGSVLWANERSGGGALGVGSALVLGISLTCATIKLFQACFSDPIAYEGEIWTLAGRHDLAILRGNCILRSPL